MTFKELQLSDKVLVALEKANFNEATEIQARAIPLFLEGKNIFGKSSTGTGKTASFVLPILEKIEPNKRRVQAVIMAPTRELAMQIVNQIRIFGSRIENLVIAPLIGGADMRDQIKRLKDSQIVVGTPGRVNDHLNRKTLKLDDVRTIILDEADEMLKMGFKNEIDALFERVSPDVQIGLFSATTSPKVMQIANDYMNEYDVIEIENQIEVNANITNTFIFTKGFSKEDLIVKVFEKHQPKRAIVFSNTKNHTDKIADNLEAAGIRAIVINGDKRQSQRSRAIAKFRNNEISVLVATDVVARGIDITGVDYVINYDVSMEDEHFVHRIGRTGRNNTKGDSITFVQNQNVLRQIRGIEKNFNLIIDEMQISEYGEVDKQEGRGNSNRSSRGDRRDSSRGDRRDSNRGDRRDSSRGDRRDSNRGDRRDSGRGDRRDSNRGRDDRRNAGHNDRRDFAHGERKRTSERLDSRSSAWTSQSWEERMLSLSPEEKEFAKKALSLVDDYSVNENQDSNQNVFERNDRRDSGRGDRRDSGRGDRRSSGRGRDDRTDSNRGRDDRRDSNHGRDDRRNSNRGRDDRRTDGQERDNKKFEGTRHSSWYVKTDYSKQDSGRWERVTGKEKRPDSFNKKDGFNSNNERDERRNRRSSGRGEWVHSGPRDNKGSGTRNRRNSSSNSSSRKPKNKW
ncbi:MULTISPECIES: DEAD/DEAH box helicase [Mesoplasma]|uniref:RNA helicase n=1 Tax=Mesoplasma florum TaxID=2151 RepID=A0A2R3P7X5_MESFO|nr:MULTISPECIES: DEAD/DEAH box helicase [Mesoplasma]AVN64587.1 ATP-dependent helicase [Mesoplasma florum]